MAAALEGGDDRQPHRPAADDETGLPRPEAGQPHRVLADREWFGQRGQLGRQLVGHGEAEQFLEHHVLGQRAGVGVGIADLLDAGRVRR